MMNEHTIGIDARLLFGSGSRTGIGIYTRGLVKALASMKSDYDFNFYTDMAGDMPGLESHNSRVYPIKIASRNLWTQVFLPLFLRKHSVGLYHGTCNFEIPILDKPCRYLLTVHDIIPITHPEVVSRKFHFLFKLMLSAAIKRADAVITVSKASKDEILKHYRLDGNLVGVVHNGVSSQFKVLADSSAYGPLKARLGITKRFVLFVGALEPRKNLGLAIKAFNKFNEARENSFQMVIVGQKWYGKSEFASADIVQAGPLDTSDIILLMNCAQAFFFPSLYEGFGLPVLEAMKCGLPVVASYIPSVREICADAAAYFDPRSISEMSNTLGRVMDGKSLREEMSRKGLERGGKFSWQKTAQRTLSVYSALL
jgi:glycosyltransferase involved in cell wall biosynthesis